MAATTPTVGYTRGADLSGSLEGAGGIGGLLGRSDGYFSGNWTSQAFYHSDGNGSITYLVDSSQAVAASYRYDPCALLVEAVWRFLKWQPNWKAAQRMKIKLADGPAIRKKAVIALARRLAIDLRLRMHKLSPER